MFSNLKRTAVGGVLFLGLLGLPAAGDESVAPAPAGGAVSAIVQTLLSGSPGSQGLDARVEAVNMRDVDLAQAVRSLADQYGVNVAIGKDVQGTVNCSLAGVTVREALEAFLRSNGYTYVQRAGVLVVVKEGQEKDFDKAAVARKMVRRTFRVPYTGKEQEFTAGAAVPTKKEAATPIDEIIRKMLSSRGRLAYYERQHLIVVEDDEDIVAMIEEFINSLWATPIHVHIDSSLLEVTLGDGEDLGLRWEVQRGISSTGKKDDLTGELETAGTVVTSGAPSLGLDRFFSYGVVNANIEVVLEAMRTRSRVDLHSNPTMLVMNHRTASIVVGQEVPYVSSEESTGGNPIRTVEFKEVATRLDVTPHVSPDGVVFLDVHPAVKSVVGYTTDPREPIISTREAVTNVAIKSGSTLIIGGLVQRSRTDETSEMPFIARLPLIGCLFRQKSLSDTKNDLIFLLTPTVVTPDFIEEGFAAKQHLMEPMPPHREESEPRPPKPCWEW